MGTASHVGLTPLDCSDDDLVAAVRRGSDAAFEELYSRYSDRIGAYVRGMVGDHGRAEDVTQEIFIAALRRMRETDRPIAFKPWIHEIAKNACIDSFRRTRRAQEISLDADEGLSSADRGRLMVVSTPDAVLDSKQALQDLRGAFGGLSDSHHEILVLREFEGRSYRDIGERLGMSRHVVESTLFRARRRLAEEYDELASGRRCEFVRKMVDSGPHYSLGIRDRRRIARHLVHCQPCRAHARSAGFDESILNMPRVASRLGFLLPLPLLRGIFERFGSHRGRPSVLAWRSVHALAGSSDQIVGAGAGAGRTAATAAALVLASVGGGIVSANYAQDVNPFSGGGRHTSVYSSSSAGAPARNRTTAGRAGARIYTPGTKNFLPLATGAGFGAGSSHRAGDSRGGDRAGSTPMMSSRSASPLPAGSGEPISAGNPNITAAAGTGAPGDSTVPSVSGSGVSTTGGGGNPSTGSGSDPTTSSGGDPSASSGGSPTGTSGGDPTPGSGGEPPKGGAGGSPTSAPVQTGTPPDPAAPVSATLSSGIGTITGLLPSAPAANGGSSGATTTGPVASTLGAVGGGLAQLSGKFRR